MVHYNSSNTACQLFPDYPKRCNVILDLRHAMASISLISCVFCLFIIWAFRKYENFSQRLIAWLTVAALFDSTAYLMGEPEKSSTTFCIFQGFWLSFFDWASLLWVCCISFNLYWNVIKLRATQRFEYVYHGICWLVPLLFSCIPFARHDGYGPSGLWCWITNDYIAMRFALWYVPVWVTAITLLVVYVYIIYKLKQQVGSWEGTYNPETQRMKELLKEDISGLKYYPLVYLIISVFPTINRVQNAAADNNIYALFVLHTLTSPLQGFLNAIVFTFDPDTRSRLTLHQLWASVRSRFSDSHSVQPYRAEASNSSSYSPPLAVNSEGSSLLQNAVAIDKEKEMH